MSDLKPCPFCGGVAMHMPRNYVIGCKTCGVWMTDNRKDDWNRRTQPEATATAQDLSAAILALPRKVPEAFRDQENAYLAGARDMRKDAASIASSANALSAGDRVDARNKALDDAAARVEDEVCGCCWPEDVQEFASHVAETIRAMKEDSKNG